ncbi:MAG: FecR domain-containing protein [Deltaproteobacteria bacterium]|nr:FecR domain-containing protein [Deltaproteobacteria bacterium]MBN2672061.1 FecR domain-containing protein [Deltaproteobacteria bacterium]
MNNKEHEQSFALADKAMALLAIQKKQDARHLQEDDLFRRRTIDEAIHRANASSPVSVAVTRGRVWAAVAGFVFVLSGLIIYAALDRGASLNEPIGLNSPPPQVTQVSEFIPESRFSLLHGEVRCDDTAVKLGEQVPDKQWIDTADGEVSFSLPTGIAVGLSTRTSARVVREGSLRYRVDVNKGMALFSVHPQKERDKFIVKTPHGWVEVTGTLFTVEVRQNGGTQVYLHKGSVVVHLNNGDASVAKQAESASLGDTLVITQPDSRPEAVAAQLQRMGCMDDGRIFSELDNTACAHEKDDSSEKMSSSLSVVRPVSKKKIDVPKVPSYSAEELLQSARTARREGRFADSADWLKQLIQQYPQGNDARTALVSLGRLELYRLGQSQAALTHFTAYLTQDGPLTPEALLGKAGAHRALGDRVAEKNCLEKLVEQFPDELAAVSAARRLAEMARQ